MQGLKQEQIYMQIFLNCHLAAFSYGLKICMYINNCSCISPRVTLPIQLATMHLMPVLGLTNPLGHVLISALVLIITSHLKCQTIFLILLWEFFNSPKLFLLSIIIITYRTSYLHLYRSKEGKKGRNKEENN